MSYKEQKIVELSEKKFSVEKLIYLYEQGRIHFPQVPNVTAATLGKKTVSGLLRAIQIGIPMPIIYASELQNGDLLVLESEDRLRYLLEYIRGDFSVPIDEMSQDDENYCFDELDKKNLRLAAAIMRTIFIFQIIDYRTPKYRHMEVGLFHEKWDVDREQAVRDELYKGQEIESLKNISIKSSRIMNNQTGSKSILRNEYKTLYMMLFWGIYNDALWVSNDMNEQELLDVTISGIDESKDVWHNFVGVIESCSWSDLQSNAYYMHFKDIKSQVKTLGSLICFYDMMQHRTADVDNEMADIMQNKFYRYQIKNMDITVRNIDALLNFGKDRFR